MIRRLKMHMTIFDWIWLAIIVPAGLWAVLKGY